MVIIRPIINAINPKKQALSVVTEIDLTVFLSIGIKFVAFAYNFVYHENKIIFIQFIPIIKNAPEKSNVLISRLISPILTVPNEVKIKNTIPIKDSNIPGYLNSQFGLCNNKNFKCLHPSDQVFK